MTGEKIMDMTRLSVLSIARHWDKLPKLIVVSDGTISAKVIKDELSFWPGELIVNDWQLTEQYHLSKNRPNLVAYAQKQVLGKKMAVIFHYSEQQEIVWIDGDILFYDDFTRCVQPHEGFACGGSEEGSSLYDDRVLQYYKSDLYQRYAFSSGLLFLSGLNVYEMFKIEGLLAYLISDYEHYFTEQTIFAHIASESLGILWPMTIIKNFNTDNQELKPMSPKGGFGRHYTANVRHLFWRDAYFNL